MDMAAKLPAMDDQELTALHANAKRLIETGTTVQQSAAADLLPSIEAEFGVRNTAKLARRAEAVATKRATKAASIVASDAKAGGKN
jgi:hypothetical protein